MHHYLDKCCFCPIAQCGKKEMGLEKSWHEYCPTCPLISNSAFPVRSDSKNLPVVPAHTKTRPLSISGLETRGKHSPGAESASLSDANNLWLRFRSRNSHTRALLHRHRSQPCSSSQCPRGSQGGSPAQDTCHDSAICKVQRVPQWHEQWRCQTVSGFSQMGGNTIPERDKCFGSTPNYSLSGRKEGKKSCSSLGHVKLDALLSLSSPPPQKDLEGCFVPRGANIHWGYPAWYPARKPKRFLAKRWLNNKTISWKPPLTLNSFC